MKFFKIFLFLGLVNIFSFVNAASIPTVSDVQLKNEIIGDSANISSPSIWANGSEVTESGVVFSETSNPTVTSGTKVSRTYLPNYFPNGQAHSAGEYMKGLAPDTTYYVRGYAVNDIGVGYSNNDLIIKTGLPNLQVVVNNPASSTNKYSIYGFDANVKNVGLYDAYTPIENMLQIATGPDGSGIIREARNGNPETSEVRPVPYSSTWPGKSIWSGGSVLVSSGISSTSTGFSFTGTRGSTQSFRVCTDQKVERVIESNEGDNCTPWKNVLVKRVPSINISASPSSGTPGINSTITWSVYNQPDSCVASGDWSGSKAFSGTETVGPLNEARVYNYTLICSNPDGDSDPGTATVTITAPIVKLPDLIISSGVVPTSALVNTATTYSAIVKNKGEGTTGASFVNLFQTATDITNLMSPVGLKDYATTSMDTLEAGATANTSKSITFSSVGTYYVRACADKSSAGDTGKIKES
ncbi:hypothetical protein M0R04_16310, partial [Candidatus Dojkabacteria bacterium]|nr:hypothetical protein [Candidatus Dojkabacteria bacterium]